MPQFSKKSLVRLREAHSKLQEVFLEVINYFDCTVVTGHRSEEEQEHMFDLGRSKVHYPDSKHNHEPALAVDVAPCPVDWEDIKRFHYFAGFVMGVAAEKGIKLRWGGDWDRDTEVKDNKFDDLLHFELIEDKNSE